MINSDMILSEMSLCLCKLFICLREFWLHSICQCNSMEILKKCFCVFWHFSHSEVGSRSSPGIQASLKRLVNQQKTAQLSYMTSKSRLEMLMQRSQVLSRHWPSGPWAIMWEVGGLHAVRKPGPPQRGPM